MQDTHVKICAWAGPIFIALFLIGYIGLAGFMPPISPADSPELVANYYKENALSLKFGLVLMMIGLGFSMPFLAAMTVQLKKICSPNSALVQTFVYSCIATTAFLYTLICAWGVASFRPDRAPEIIQAFNDLAFIMLIWPVSLIPMSYLALGIAILSDKNEVKLFPRWYAFVNFWLTVLAYGGALLILFTKGPFAWDGLIAFWLPALAFFGWYILSSILLIRSTAIEYRDVESSVE